MTAPARAGAPAPPEAETPPVAARAPASYHRGERAVTLPLRLDPDRKGGTWIDAFGRKDSGKSVFCTVYYRSWPYDSLVIDPTGDFEPGLVGVETLRDPLPYHLTPGEPGKPRRYIYHPDPGSPTYKDDLDRAVGLAFWHPKERPFLLDVDEVGELTDAGQTGANMRRTLHQCRHRNMSLILAGPRCVDLNPLVLSQADYVAFFEMPNELDQTRAAHTIGFPLARFRDANAGLDPHEYLLYTARPDPHTVDELARLEGLSHKEAREALRLVHCPPVPLPRREPPAPTIPALRA